MTTNANIIHAVRTKSGEQGEEEESRDRRRAKQVRDDNRAVVVHAARMPVRFTSARGPTQQPHGLAGAFGDDLYGDQIYVLSAFIFYSLLFPILRYSPTTSAPPPLRLPSVSSILTDTDTLFSSATGR
ncbi:hypothetical protein B0H13DRAFT_2395137 [Mycena leptocephala]|nr:hypothetical protein B0H13DRAFT_2395137 [Mycena leptocephala]